MGSSLPFQSAWIKTLFRCARFPLFFQAEGPWLASIPDYGSMYSRVEMNFKCSAHYWVRGNCNNSLQNFYIWKLVRFNSVPFRVKQFRKLIPMSPPPRWWSMLFVRFMNRDMLVLNLEVLLDCRVLDCDDPFAVVYRFGDLFPLFCRSSVLILKDTRRQ